MRAPSRHVRTLRPAFTLVEVIVFTILIGVSMVAVLGAIRSATQLAMAEHEITIATRIAQELKEWTFYLAFKDPTTPTNAPGPDSGETSPDDLDDLRGLTYSPPRDGMGRSMTHLSGWSQVITMTWLSQNDLSTAVTAGTSSYVRVDVTVKKGTATAGTFSWLVVEKPS